MPKHELLSSTDSEETIRTSMSSICSSKSTALPLCQPLDGSFMMHVQGTHLKLSEKAHGASPPSREKLIRQNDASGSIGAFRTHRASPLSATSKFSTTNSFFKHRDGNSNVVQEATHDQNVSNQTIMHPSSISQTMSALSISSPASASSSSSRSAIPHKIPPQAKPVPPPVKGSFDFFKKSMPSFPAKVEVESASITAENTPKTKRSSSGSTIFNNALRASADFFQNFVPKRRGTSVDGQHTHAINAQDNTGGEAIEEVTTIIPVNEVPVGVGGAGLVGRVREMGKSAVNSMLKAGSSGGIRKKTLVKPVDAAGLPSQPPQHQKNQQVPTLSLMPNGAKECFKPKLPKENEDVERNSRHADLVGFLNGTKALPSRFLDHYRLGELLGDGAFGFVMTATRLKDNLEVAVKFIASNKIPRELWVPDPNHPHLCKIPNEIKILQTLNHPNIIKYIDHIIEGPYILLITELHGNEWTHSNTIAHKHNNQLDRCDGDVAPAAEKKRAASESDAATANMVNRPAIECSPLFRLTPEQEKQIRRKTSCDLFECIDAHKRIPEPLARKIFAQIAFAVNYLHERNLVHRDLKDENIVIDANYAIKIIDFGSVATIPQRKCDYFTRFNGTIHFASPEITNNQPYRGPEAEMWSMGVLLYTMVFGENPFHNPADIIRGDFRMPFDAELESDKDGEGCRHLIKRLLTYNQNDRATMEEVLHHKWMRDEVVLLKAKYGL